MESKRSLHKAGALLLLLVSNLLLCKNAASLPACPMVNIDCTTSLEKLLDRAQVLSNYIHYMAWEMYNDFGKDCNHDTNTDFMGMEPCHTSSIYTGDQGDIVRAMSDETLLRTILTLLQAWNISLVQEVTEVCGSKANWQRILPKIQETEYRILQLTDGLQGLCHQAYPDVTHDPDYPVWKGLPYGPDDNHQTRRTAFASLLRCMRRDTDKIRVFLRILKCRHTKTKTC